MHPTDDRLTQILLEGARLRALSAQAPYFGPRADASIQAAVWARIDGHRARLDALLEELADGDGSLLPILQLEAEGCGERFYKALEHQRPVLPRDGESPLWPGPLAAWEPDVEEPRGAEILHRERRVLASRVAAARGAQDPDPGLGDLPDAP